MKIEEPANTCVHHHVLNQVVCIVGESQHDFLVFLSVEPYLKYWLFALFVDLGLDGFGPESKFEDCLTHISLAGRLRHDHLDLASLDDVVVEFDAVAVEGVERHCVLLLVE